MFYFTIAVFILIAIIFSWLIILLDSKKTNVRGPFPLPIVGNGLLFFGNSAQFLRALSRLSQIYEDAVRIYILHKRFLVLSHPKFIEPILTSSKTITKGYKVTESWLGEGLIRASGVRWKTHRKFLTPAFHFNMLPTFLPAFLKNQNILIDKLQEVADGNSVNLFPIIALTALDNIAESIMGVSLNAQRHGESKYVNSIEKISKIIALKMRLLVSETLFNWSPYKKKQDEIIKYLHEKTVDVIEARRAVLKKSNITHLDYNPEHGTKNKNAFLDLLLLTEVEGKKIDINTVREEVENFMFAGHDTTASGIVFCLYCLSRHKEIQNKVFEEQKAVFGKDMDRDPEYSDLLSMKYLELVIKESLRLYPPVPVIERLITEDINMGGIIIPSETTVVINIFQMHRHPDLFDEPLAFRPERFQIGVKPFSWIPFSAGLRNCIGLKLAMLEMKVIVSSIIRNFVLLPSEIEPKPCAEIILRSLNGVHVKLKQRNNN